MAIEIAKLFVSVEARTQEAEAGLKRFQSALYGLSGGGGGGGGGVGDVFKGIIGANILTSAASQVRTLSMEALNAYSSFERLGYTLQTLTARELMNSGAATSMADALKKAGPAAQDLVKWTEQLAIKSPFTQDDVAQAFRMAQAYGFNTTEAKRLTTVMTDYAAGSGATGDAMQHIVLALGQIRAKGKLAGQEVLQLVNAGLPVDAILATAFGKTTAEIVKMREQGLIPANQAVEAIVQSLEQDFGGAAERQSNTFSGLVSSLEDIKKVGLREFFTGTFEAIQPYLIEFVGSFTDGTFQATLREWGATLGEFVGEALEYIGDLMAWWNDLDQSTKNLLVTFVGFQVAGPPVIRTLGDIVGGAANTVGGLQSAAAAAGRFAQAFGSGWSANLGSAGSLLADVSGGATKLSLNLGSLGAAWKSGLLTSSLSTALGGTVVAVGAIAVGVAALVAVWYQWNEQITKTNEEGQKATSNAWDKFFTDLESSGKSATQVTDEYTAAVERTNAALEKAPWYVRIFITEQDKLTSDFDGLSKALLGVSSGYADYDANLRRVAEKQGLVIDAHGDLIRITQGDFGAVEELVQENYLLSQSEYDAALAIEEVSRKAKAGEYDMYGLANASNDVGMGVRQIQSGAQTGAAGVMELTEEIDNSKTVMEATTAALKEMGLTEEEIAAESEYLAGVLGLTKDAIEQVREDTDLLTRAHQSGLITQEEYDASIQQLRDGTLQLSDAQRDGYEASLKQAEGLRLAAEAATEARIRQLEMQQTLSDAWNSAQERYNQGVAQLNQQRADVSQKIQDLQRQAQKAMKQGDRGEFKRIAREIAGLNKEAAQAAGQMSKLADEMKKALEQAMVSSAMGELNRLRDSGAISGDEYASALEGIQQAYGLVNDQGINMAKGIALMSEALEKGTLSPEHYGVALRILSDDIADGIVDMDAFKQYIGLVGDTATTTAPLVTAAGQEIATGVSASAAAVGTSTAEMTGSVTQAASDMSEAAKKGAQEVVTAFNHPDWIGLGENIGGGIAQGIRNSIPNVAGAAAAAAQSAETAANQEAEVQSPSKKLERTGVWMMEGLKQGIQNNVDRPAVAMARAMRQTIGGDTRAFPGDDRVAQSSGRRPSSGPPALRDLAQGSLAGGRGGGSSQPINLTVNVANEEVKRVLVRSVARELSI